MATMKWTDTDVSELGINVPAWMSDVTDSDVCAIVEGGCASGAYMPAVTYYDAAETMKEHGDAVIQYLEDNLGEVPAINWENHNWYTSASFYLAYAVELWASSVFEDAEYPENEEDEE